MPFLETLAVVAGVARTADRLSELAELLSLRWYQHELDRVADARQASLKPEYTVVRHTSQIWLMEVPGYGEGFWFFPNRQLAEETLWWVMAHRKMGLPPMAAQAKAHLEANALPLWLLAHDPEFHRGICRLEGRVLRA